MSWKEKLINHVINELKNDKHWLSIVDKLVNGSNVAIHLAIFNEPFLSLVLSGEKKIESRFSVNRISPFEKVTKGDIIILKGSGKPITGVCLAGDIKYFDNLDKGKLKDLESNYGLQICSSRDQDFWNSRQKTNYATLIEIEKVKKLNPYISKKTDRLAWSVLRQRLGSTLFEETKPIEALKTVIALSGKISSGKSTVADFINKNYNFPIVSFGAYLKSYCLSKNLPTTRETLQNVGEKLIQKDPERFLINVINFNTEKSDIIILDGVRHKIILEALNKLINNVIVIYIETDFNTRSIRYLSRKKSTDNTSHYNNLIVADNHPVESEIDILKTFSHITIDSSKDYKKTLLESISLRLPLQAHS